MKRRIKKTMARCQHGIVWFYACPDCDLNERVWLSEIKNAEERKILNIAIAGMLKRQAMFQCRIDA